jgi:hypothetical protein
MKNITEKQVVEIKGFYVINHAFILLPKLFFVILNFDNNMFRFVSAVPALLRNSRRVRYFSHSMSYGL